MNRQRLLRRLIPLFVAFVTTGAFADWTKVGHGITDFDLYADPSTTDKEGDVVRMSDLLDLKWPRVVSGISYLSIKTRHEYNCKDQKARILAFSWYPKNMGNGVPVHTDDEAFEWEAVPANTTSDILWNVACKGTAAR